MMSRMVNLHYDGKSILLAVYFYKHSREHRARTLNVSSNSVMFQFCILQNCMHVFGNKTLHFEQQCYVDYNIHVPLV